MPKRKKNRILGLKPSRLHQAIHGLVLASALVASPTAMADSSDTKRNYHISSGSLSHALSEFAGSAGILLSVDARLTDGKTSKGLEGEYTVEEGFKKLLAGSGLIYTLSNDNSVAIKVAESGSDGAATLLEVKVSGKLISDSPSMTTPSIADSKAKLNRVPGGTTVIDAQRINEGLSFLASDTLASAPGVYVGDNSTGPGGGVHISVRGSDVNSIFYPIRGLKVLRNGLPFTSANGDTDTQMINLYSIDHIEVYRGASALEYGGSNLGGAINYITPTAYTSDPLKIGMVWGTNGYVKPSISGGKVFDNGFDAFGSFTYLDTETTRVNNNQEEFFGQGNIGYRWNNNQETRLFVDIQNHNILGARPLSQSQIKDNPHQNPSRARPPYGMKVERVDLKHSVNLNDGDHLDVGAYYSSKEYSFSFPFGVFQDHWEDAGASLRHEINSNLLGLKNKIVWGALSQWLFIKDNNYSPNKVALRNAERDRHLNVEGFIEDQLKLSDTFTLIGGVQLNYRDSNFERIYGYAASDTMPGKQGNKDFFTANPKLGFTWQATSEAQIYGNLSRSSEPVPLFDLENIYVRPALNNQTGSTVEIGTRGEKDKIKWDLSFYHAWLNNEYLIIPDPTSANNFIASNANSTTLHTGIEMGLEKNLPLNLASMGDELRLSGNYTWSNFRFSNDTTYGDNRLPGVPEHYAHLEALYKHPSGFYIGPTAQIVGRNSVDFANTISAKPYALLGARMGWDDGKHWKLFIDGRNLTDEHYASSVWVMANAAGQDQPQFNPGATRSVFGGVEYRF